MPFLYFGTELMTVYALLSFVAILAGYGFGVWRGYESGWRANAERWIKLSDLEAESEEQSSTSSNDFALLLAWHEEEMTKLPSDHSGVEYIKESMRDVIVHLSEAVECAESREDTQEELECCIMVLLHALVKSGVKPSEVLSRLYRRVEFLRENIADRDRLKAEMIAEFKATGMTDAEIASVMSNYGERIVDMGPLETLSAIGQLTSKESNINEDPGTDNVDSNSADSNVSSKTQDDVFRKGKV